MKRSGPPRRRSALLTRRVWRRTSTSLDRSSSLRAVSAKRRRQLTGRAEIRAHVFERDGYRCQLAGVPGAGECFGMLTPHHVRKDGQGGSYTLDNLVTLCADHNDRIESDADLAVLARSRGLVKLRGD